MTAPEYSFTISESFEDSDWDTFLEETTGGDHLQTSLWSQVKASVGWHPIRIVVSCEREIVAGAQILVRDVPIAGSIGVVARGPVLAYEEPGLAEVVTTELQKITQSYPLRYLCVQPPLNYEYLSRSLRDRGFSPSPLKLTAPATTRLDLSNDLDAILAGMKSRTRHNIRRSKRKGVIVRAGTADDLASYYRLVRATTQRKQFAAFSRRYYDELWYVLQPRGYLHLLVAEFEGEIISQLMLIPFGDTVVNKLGVWSGKHGDKRPNDAIHWGAVELGKSLGLRFYDMGGISARAAKAVLQGKPRPESDNQSVTSFKLDFGGDVVVFPTAADYLPNPVYRWAFTELYPKIKGFRSVKDVFNRLRTRGPSTLP